MDDKELKKLFKADLTKTSGLKDEIKIEEIVSQNINEEPKPRKRKFRWKIFVPIMVGVTLTIAIVVPIGYGIISNLLTYKYSFRETHRNYNNYDVQLAESNSFSKLNSIVYPSTSFDKHAVENDFYLDMNDFANTIYSNIDDKEDNFMFSPFTLYSQLTFLDEGSSDPLVNQAMEGLLGNNKEYRQKEYLKAYQNNYYIAEDNTLQMYHSFFLNYLYEVNPTYLDTLTQYYVEAYRANFYNQDDVNKILEWVDRHLDTNGFLSPEDLEINEFSMAILMSTMYFKNKWEINFDESDTYRDIFYASEEYQTDYMNHLLYGYYYDYGDYVTLYDFYETGAKIKYIVPKNIEDDIFELTQGINLFYDDETKISNQQYIDLHVPKFDVTYKYKFNDVLTKLGLGMLFDIYYDSFNEMFVDENDNLSVSVRKIETKSNIALEESGTTIRNITFSLPLAGAAGGQGGDTYIIKLNQPFIYIIYDNNNLPLFVGEMHNPTKN